MKKNLQLALALMLGLATTVSAQDWSVNSNTRVNNMDIGGVTSMDTEQMAKDVSTFLAWAAEPNLEQRHKMGFRAVLYLIIITILVYFSMKKIWSRIETDV